MSAEAIEDPPEKFSATVIISYWLSSRAGLLLARAQ